MISKEEIGKAKDLGHTLTSDEDARDPAFVLSCGTLEQSTTCLHSDTIAQIGADVVESTTKTMKLKAGLYQLARGDANVTELSDVTYGRNGSQACARTPDADMRGSSRNGEKVKRRSRGSKYLWNGPSSDYRLEVTEA